MTLPELRNVVRFKPWVSQRDAAALLGISKVRVWQLVRDGKLESFAFLGARCVLLTAVINRMEQRIKVPARGVKCLR